MGKQIDNSKLENKRKQNNQDDMIADLLEEIADLKQRVSNLEGVTE